MGKSTGNPFWNLLGMNMRLANLQELCKKIAGFLPTEDGSLLEQGMSSIKMMQLVGEIYNSTGEIIDLIEVISTVSCKDIVDIISTNEAASHSMLEINTTEGFKINNYQQTVLEISKYPSASKAYNEGVSFEINGPLDINKCEEVLRMIVKKYPLLRSQINESGALTTRGYQEIENMIRLSVTDISSSNELFREVNRLHEDSYNKVFDLEKFPSFEVNLWKLSENKFVVSWTIYHIFTDWWSVGLLRKDAVNFYMGDQSISSIQEIPIATTLDKIRPSDEEYWKNYLSLPAKDIDLNDKRRPIIKSYSGDTYISKVASVNTVEMREAAKIYRTSCSSLAFSILSATIWSITGNENFMVGVPFINRNDPVLANKLGYFVNGLPIRVKLNSELTKSQVVSLVSAELSSCYAHGVYPSRFLKDFNPKKTSLSRSPFYDWLFTYYDDALPLTFSENKEFSVKEIELSRGTSKFDISFFLIASGDDLEIKIEYQDKIIDRNQVAYLAEIFEFVLREFTNSGDGFLKDIKSCIASI